MTRLATVEGYYGAQAALNANKLTKAQWQTYEILWHKGPMDQKTLNEIGKGQHGATSRPMWAAQLKKLQALGLVAEDGGRWDVTSAAALQEVTIAKKPSKKKFAKGVDDIELALTRAESVGLDSPEAAAVVNWLRSKVR